MVHPSPNSIKDSVETSTSALEWIVEVLRGNNLVKKFLLIDAVFMAIFNPPSFRYVFRLLTARDLTWYPWFFTTVSVVLFIAAVVAAMRTKAKQLFEGEWKAHMAIKCLLPFTLSDADLFRRMQREKEVRGWLPALLDRDFRFGVLTGESGCGKTSFLQAALWPRLVEHGRCCIYVKFTHLDPLDSIRLAIWEHFKVSAQDVKDATLLTLLESTFKYHSQPVILLFDQFEQFFVHRKRDQERQPFFQSMADLYRREAGIPISVLVCIRGDYAGRLFDLQRTMGCSLGPLQSLELKKF